MQYLDPNRSGWFESSMDILTALHAVKESSLSLGLQRNHMGPGTYIWIKELMTRWWLSPPLYCLLAQKVILASTQEMCWDYHRSQLQKSLRENPSSRMLHTIWSSASILSKATHVHAELDQVSSSSNLPAIPQRDTTHSLRTRSKNVHKNYRSISSLSMLRKLFVW